jgi:hypothetical protein
MSLCGTQSAAVNTVAENLVALLWLPQATQRRMPVLLHQPRLQMQSLSLKPIPLTQKPSVAHRWLRRMYKAPLPFFWRWATRLCDRSPRYFLKMQLLTQSLHCQAPHQTNSFTQAIASHLHLRLSVLCREHQVNFKALLERGRQRSSGWPVHRMVEP